MSDIDVLESVLIKDATLLAGVEDSQRNAATPCPDYDVQTLTNHIIGWLRAFAAVANNRTFEGDPSAYQTEDPVTDFHAASAEVIHGWRTYGVDRTVPNVSGQGDGTPAEQNLAMAIMEYTGHGWDLAKATGQEVPFTDEELEIALAYGKQTLPDEYRGDGMPFGHAIEVPDDASAADRFAAFLGRRP